MTLNIQRNFYKWVKVKGISVKPLSTCPRCQNNVKYELVSDGVGVGLPGFWTFKYNKVYAYKCPVCPNFEEITKELAKAIINEERQ
jgi:predicted nucleic acid-binding Zn ribbon protein